MAVSVETIVKNIEDDNVHLSLGKLEAEKIKSDSKGWTAYAVIVSLNKLVLTALKNKETCQSSVEDIYKLAELCCNVEPMWGQDRTACMQCVYHVMRYILNQSHPELAKRLCEHFFILRKNKKFVKWEEKEILVLSNSVIYFVYYINDISKDIDKAPYNPDIQVLTIFRFVLKISELSDFSSTAHLFQVAFFLLRRAQNLLKHNDYIKFSMDVLSCFSGHLRTIVDTGLFWNPKEENINYSVNMLSDIIFLFKSNEFSEQAVDNLINFMDCLKTLTFRAPQPSNGKKSVDFEMLQNTLKMCLYSTESTFSSYFDGFCTLLSSKTNSNCYPFIHACLSTFRSKIGSLLYKDDAKMKQFFPGLLKIYIQSKSKMTEEQRSKRSELLHTFTNAMYFLNTSKISSSALASLFKYVGAFFKEFDGFITGNKTSFEFGVNYCINAIQSFKESELYKEAATLSKSLIKQILQLNSEFLSLDTFEIRLDHLLNFFVQSFCKMGLVTEAQIGLIAFVGVHPKFNDVVFKYWAELKVNCQDDRYKDSTSYDIITSEMNVIEEKWPPCKVESINIEQCLLGELRAYSKHRELQIGPVIAVFKVASKLVKDKLLLASIVTATVDAVSSDEYIPTLKNLHLSLENLFNNNVKLEGQDIDERKLCCRRLAIGDILYQLIRCDIVELRKKAEEELSLMNLPSKEDVPVIEGEASTVTPAYTYLTIGEQTQLFEKMNKVIYYWKIAETIVTPEDMPFIHFRYMKGLAYIFRLYSYKTKEIEMWETIYCIAKKVCCHKYQVLAVAELFILKANIISKWLNEVEELVKNETIVSKKNYIYSLYFVNLGKYLFTNNKFDEATKTIEELDESILKRQFLVNAQQKLLLFSLKKDRLDLSPKKTEFTLYILVQIFESILFLVKNSRWKTFCEKCVLQWLLLEYSLTISKMYYDLRLMRHTRCFAKKQLTVAQRLALPVRVCEFLTLLSLADLQTGNRTEASEKLFGLDSILQLDAVKVAENSDKTDVCYYFSKTSSEKEVNQPLFLSHPLDCNCIICDNVDFLVLVLEAFTLKGIFTSSAGARSLAKHIFNIGKSLMDFAAERVEKCYSNIPNRYHETKVRFYLNLTIAHANWEETDEALIYNNMILKSMKTCSRVLQEEISYHSAALDWLCYEKPPSVIYKPKLYKDSNDSSMQNQRTPEPVKPQNTLAKGLKVFSSSKKFKVPVSPRPSFVKKCIFEDSEDSTDEGKYTNKENFDVNTPERKESKFRKEKNTLAVPLPLSPCNSIKKTICFEKSDSLGTPKTSDWCLETPKERKTYSARSRKVQTEKKATKGPVVNLFSTPFPTKTGPEIKVFCDEDIEYTSKTVKRRGRPPKSTTTVKKTNKKVKNAAIKLIGGRKLFESDTEEETKPRRSERRLFIDSEELTETPKQQKDSLPNSDESAIIDASYIEKPVERKLCLPLTPSSTELEHSLKQLSISDKKDKLFTLSTRNMRKLKISQDTSQSTPQSRK